MTDPWSKVEPILNQSLFGNVGAQKSFAEELVHKWSRDAHSTLQTKTRKPFGAMEFIPWEEHSIIHSAELVEIDFSALNLLSLEVRVKFPSALL